MPEINPLAAGLRSIILGAAEAVADAAESVIANSTHREEKKDSSGDFCPTCGRPKLRSAE